MNESSFTVRLVIAATAILFAVQNAVAPLRAPRFSYRVMHVYPHDPKAFTEGLEYRDGYLYEATGANRSGIRKVDLKTGRVLQELPMDQRYFGEGITTVGDRTFQLTWQSQHGFIYDARTFRLIQTFAYPGEGWGLTNDGSNIFMSDGTAEIRRWDPANLRETGRILVHDGKTPIASLNELEYVGGEIYANLFWTNKIARISPRNGEVLGWIDLTGLLPAAEQPHDMNAVLNGIAWDRQGGRLFVTGKLWPSLFEIQITSSPE